MKQEQAGLAEHVAFDKWIGWEMIVDMIDTEWDVIDESSERAGSQNLTRRSNSVVSRMMVADLQGLRG